MASTAFVPHIHLLNLQCQLSVIEQVLSCPPLCVHVGLQRAMRHSPRCRILARVEKAKDSSGQKVLMSGRAVLQPTVKQTYDGLADKKGRYVWLYAGESSWWAQYLPYIILFAILAICMFPLWPIWLKKGVFWASVAFLVVFIGFLIVRYSVALLAWLFGFEFWIFPNFWDDSLSVSDSFKPFIQAGLDPDASSYLLYRLAVLGLLSGAGYWAYSQPDDVANMMQGQAKFMEDLYSGALMQQASEVRLPGQDQKFGSRNSWNGQDAPRVRAFDDIWADLEKEEASDEPQQQQAEGAAQADEDAAAAAGGDAQQGQAEDAAPVEDDSAAHMSDEDIMAEVAAEAAAHEKDIGRD